MENEPFGQGQSLTPAPPMLEGSRQAEAPLEKKRRFWKFAVWFVAIIAAALALASLAYYMSPEARSDRELQRNYQKYQQGMNDFETAMRADTYGGKTPQETLDLFVDALKKGDVELASKYFSLETDTKSPDYLTRKKWEDVLRKISVDNSITDLISLLEKSKPAGYSIVDYFGFEVRDDTEKLIGDIGMHLNKYSQVWKIESL